MITKLGRLFFFTLLGMAFLFAILFTVAPASAIGKTVDVPALFPSVTPVTTTQQLFLPIIHNVGLPLAWRLGFGAGTVITQYAALSDLHAGWYVNWGVDAQAVQPAGIEHVQMVRVHQKLSCGLWHHGDRAACPYALPLEYNFAPEAAVITAAAQAQPGQLWIIGNEMDRVDWRICAEFESDGHTCKPDKIVHQGQDEILPEVYALAYHDLYTLIKQADPTAQVAIGGVIQGTPLRLQYLTMVWDSYKQRYGQEMPVDVWNIHAFILREKKYEYGADIPPGLMGNPTTGQYTTDDWTHLDHTIFDTQIRAMRQWMKERGQQDKPLVITEYGALYVHCVAHDNQGNCTKNFNSATLVQDFMVWSFDYFLNTKDCSLGYAQDDCRLVQRWLWFSLDHAYQDANGQLTGGFNLHGSLFNATTLQMTAAGQRFRDFALANIAQLAK